MNAQQGRLEDHLGTFRVAYGSPRPTVSAHTEIVRLRAAGYGPTGIARSLNKRQIPTPSGKGRWHPQTVARYVDPAPWRDYMRRYRAANRR